MAARSQRPGWSWTMRVVTLGALTGLFVELLQPVLTSVRRFEVADLIADLVGVGLGVGMVIAAAMYKSAHRPIQRLTLYISLLGLVVITASVLWTSSAVEAWRQCRDLPIADLEPSSPLVESGPVLRIDLREGVAMTSNASVEVPNGTDDGLMVPAGEPVEFTDMAAVGCAAVKTNEFTLVTQVASGDLAQDGPARIATFSTSTFGRDQNLHLGQQGSEASIRIRVSRGAAVWTKIPNVFVDTSPHVVGVRYDAGTVTLFVDGDIVTTYELPASSLAGWDLSYPLTIGDEATGDRTFTGTIGWVELYRDALSESDMAALAR